jgi:hypothetical protein
MTCTYLAICKIRFKFFSFDEDWPATRLLLCFPAKKGMFRMLGRLVGFGLSNRIVKERDGVPQMNFTGWRGTMIQATKKPPPATPLVRHYPSLVCNLRAAKEHFS